MNDKLGYIHQIRDQKYYIEIIFFNQIEGESPLSVPFFYVDSLIINETIKNWATTGSIVLNTSFEIFSRGNPTNYFSNDINSKKIKAPYIERTDGRNKLSIKIYPIESENNRVKQNNDYYPKDKWEMSFDFVITHIEDLPTPNAQVKKRRYNFIDERYQILKERNLEWSSAIIAAKNINKKPYELTDIEKKINPNELLKELLKLAGTNPIPSFNSNSLLYVGFKEGENIDNPTIPFSNIDALNWDSGNADNKIPYHTSARHTALDDLNEILSYCVASDGGPVILEFGRYTDDKKWKLIPLSRFFQNSSGEQIEHLILEASTGIDEKSTPHISRGPRDTGNIMSPIASRIQRYKFSPMTSLDDNRITNSAVHYYDHATGSFHVKLKKNTVENVINSLENYAKSGLYSFKSGTNPQILLSLNKTKTTGLMFENKQSYNGSSVYDGISHNQMLLDSVFLNQSVSFQTFGLTLRSPGKFIFIDRIDSGDSNPFDDRFLGQWFLTDVSHMFTQETYITEVIAVKIDSFNKIWNKKDQNF